LNRDIQTGKIMIFIFDSILCDVELRQVTESLKDVTESLKEQVNVQKALNTVIKNVIFGQPLTRFIHLYSR
jgi:uncharacterized Fe-S cluster-containing protein